MNLSDKHNTILATRTEFLATAKGVKIKINENEEWYW
jgi:hypothetical protein